MNEEIFEDDILFGESLGDKSYAYYEMSISDRYFNGSQYLAIKVIPETFDSDPDIFISKVSYHFLYKKNLEQNKAFISF